MILNGCPGSRAETRLGAQLAEELAPLVTREERELGLLLPQGFWVARRFTAAILCGKTRRLQPLRDKVPHHFAAVGISRMAKMLGIRLSTSGAEAPS